MVIEMDSAVSVAASRTWAVAMADAALRIGLTRDGKPFRLPPALGTQTSAIVGIRGSGKTVTGTVVVEELLRHQHQVVVLDPTDVWWGLKSSADGAGAGFPVVVLGGPYGNLPLEPDMAAAIADFAVESRMPLVLSLRHLRKGKQQALVTDFCEQLYHRKGEAANRTPVLVAIDEASAFVPQRVGGAEARMVGATEDLVRRGRSAGIGVALIDQRPASVNTDVLTQLEVLVAHRITSPQDSKALDERIRLHDTGGHRDTFLAELPSLPQGATWFWSPGMDVLSRVQVRMRETYDSSRTPKPGEELEAPSGWAAVDIGALGKQLAAAVKDPEENDPKALRRRIAELERERDLAVAHDRQPYPTAEAYEQVCAALNEHKRQLAEATERLRQIAGLAASDRTTDLGAFPHDPADDRLLIVHPAPAAPPPPALLPEESEPDHEEGSISGPQQRILDALAGFSALGIRDVSRSNVAVFADQSSRSSGFANILGHLRTGGYLNYPSGGMVALTIRGQAYASKNTPIASRRELHDAWFQKLSNPQSAILKQAIRCYPKSIDRTELAHLAHQSPTSSGYANNLGQLRSLGLIDYPSRGRVAATALLFPEGLR